jgi:uncharacterized protein DUF3810
MRPRLVRLAIVMAAVAAVFLPVSRAAVERHYSERAYGVVQAILTGASNRTPIALFDLIIAIAATTWLARSWWDVRHAPTRLRAAGRVAARSAVWCAATYLIFLATWGLNYRRVPLREKLPYDESAITPAAALAAAHATVDRVNALHPRAHAAGWPAAHAVDVDLAAGFSRALRDTHLAATAVPGRPKSTVLDWYFRRSGTDGMTDPFLLETLVASSLLPFERPFVVAHEWGHLAGIGDEGEANFVGWLTCMRAGAPAQYSGALFLYRELAGAVAPRDRPPLAAALADGPREDLRAIQRRYDREVSPRLSAAGWQIYDSYLRANRVDAGTASYAEVVKLVLGVRLDP